MRTRPPIYVLPLLIIGALALDKFDDAYAPKSRTAEPGDLATTMRSTNPPKVPRVLALDALNTATHEESSIALQLGREDPVSRDLTIGFELSRPGYVQLSVYDARGRVVRLLSSEVWNAGVHERRWDGCTNEGSPVDGGIYFARLESLGEVASLRLVLNRDPLGDEG